MDSIHGSGPIRPNIPGDASSSTSKTSERAQQVLERTPETLRTFTKQLGQALDPLRDEKEGLHSTLQGGRALDNALTRFNEGDIPSSLKLIGDAQALPGLPSDLKDILSKSAFVLKKGGNPDSQHSELQNLNEFYMHTASMKAMDFSHKIIKSGESLGRMTMELKSQLNDIKLPRAQ